MWFRDLPHIASDPHNTDNLPSVNKIGIGEAVASGQTLPAHSIAPRNPAQRISARYHI